MMLNGESASMLRLPLARAGDVSGSGIRTSVSKLDSTRDPEDDCTDENEV